MAEPHEATRSWASDPTPEAGPEARLRDLWRQGLRPDVREFLLEAGALTAFQLATLLRIDQRERWGLGQRVPASTYLDDHHALRAEPEAAIELIYAEFLLREDLGEAPALEEY